MVDAGQAGANEHSIEQYLQNVPTAFAVMEGTQHTVVYANPAFRRLIGATGEVLGLPVAAIAGTRMRALSDLLDGAVRTGVVARDNSVQGAGENAPPWICTAWPEADRQGEPVHLLVEIRAASREDLTLTMQRDVSERMLLSALREQDSAIRADVSRRRATFLASEGRRLGASLDTPSTIDAVSRLALPHVGAWCIVDMVDRAGTMHRVAVVHPNPAKQALLRQLDGQWSPLAGDPFGAPLMMRSPHASVVANDLDEAITVAAHDERTLGVLRAVGIGPLLTVPLMVGDALTGAVTFIDTHRADGYCAEDIELAESLAARAAVALENARLHGESVALRLRAEAANEAKMTFLGTMSHELRTPLNAIAGYVDLLVLELRGPLTDEQRLDLSRIKRSQRYLLGLVTDVLNFVRVDANSVPIDFSDVLVGEVTLATLGMLEPLLAQKNLACDATACETTVVVSTDRERLTQVLINLLSNAIKFTPSGGKITIRCEATESAALIHVVDTGVGISADKLQSIFDPFVQVRTELAHRDSGAGLGLAISRGLARALKGDLTVESTPGAGSRFTLALPLAARRP